MWDGNRPSPPPASRQLKPHSQLLFLRSFLCNRTRVVSMSGHSTVERGVRIRERVFSSWEELEWKQQGVGMQKAQGRGGWHCGGDWRPSGPCLSFYRCHHSQGRLIAELGLRPVPCLQIPKPPSLSLPHHLCGGPTNMPQWERGKNEDKGLEAWHLALPQSFLVASVSHFPTPHRSFVSSSYKKKKKKKSQSSHLIIL